MSTLVEKMARAIAARQWEGAPQWDGVPMASETLEMLVDDRWQSFADDALAALRAMREVPFDHALNDAGWIMLAGLEDNGTVSGHQFNNLKLIFRDALVKYFDAAIQEHSTTPPRNAS